MPTKTSLVKAKRFFLINLSLFICIGFATAFLFTGNQENDVPFSTQETAPPEKTLTMLELANMKGQMLGLSEHPGTMPEFDPEWILKASRQEVLRDPDLFDTNKATYDQLIEAFSTGYANQYNAYYNDSVGREAGFHLGLKVNPELEPHKETPSIYSLLNKHKERLLEEYAIEGEVEWHLFRRAFQRGFNDGYWLTRDGVTAESKDGPTKLFDD